MLFHAFLYALLCVAPAAVLIPVRVLDRPPCNQITQEQDPGGPAPDRDGEMRAAA